MRFLHKSLILFLISFLLGSFLLPVKSANALTPPATTGIILGHVYWNNKFSERSIKRMDKGIELFQQGKVAYLMTTGGFGMFNTSKIPMGVLMKDYLVSKGIPEGRIFVEQQSRNTDENALGALEILKEYKGLDVVVITSADHIKRAQLIFEDIFPDDYHLNFVVSDTFTGFWTVWDFFWQLGGWAKYYLAKVI